MQPQRPRKLPMRGLQTVGPVGGNSLDREAIIELMSDQVSSCYSKRETVQLIVHLIPSQDLGSLHLC